MTVRGRVCAESKLDRVKCPEDPVQRLECDTRGNIMHHESLWSDTEQMQATAQMLREVVSGARHLEEYGHSGDKLSSGND